MTLEPIQLAIQLVPGVLALEVKEAQHESNRSFPSSAVENYVIKQWENFTSSRLCDHIGVFRRWTRIFSFTSDAKWDKDNLCTSVERRNRRTWWDNVWRRNFFPKECRKLYSHLIFLFFLFALFSFLLYFPSSRIFPPSSLCDKWSHRRMPC